MNERELAELVERCRRYRGLDPRDPLEAIEDPQWDDAGSISDWRNYVPDSIKRCWGGLSLDARVVTYLQAGLRAKSGM